MASNQSKLIKQLTMSNFASFVVFPRYCDVVLLRVSTESLLGTFKCDDWPEKSCRSFTSALSSSLCSDPVNDLERNRYSINPFGEGVEITSPSGLVAESMGDLRPETGDNPNSGSEILRPWTSGLLSVIMARGFSDVDGSCSVDDDSLDGTSLAFRYLARALCNRSHCRSVTREILSSSLDLREFDMEGRCDEESASKTLLPLLEKLLSLLTEFEAPNSTLLKLLSRLTFAPVLLSRDWLSIFKSRGIASESLPNVRSFIAHNT